ncbi:ABC transporter permease [Saccharopolyspora cebuensis]|uniref:Transport permease protein n=1 Tax=Saccharopolyspora cebuensis TaxID=418759 RepID=A0ABV4CP69_9PSEU
MSDPTPSSIPVAPTPTGVGWWFSDVHQMALRNVRHIVRYRDQLGQALAQPVMFYILFTYVFGGAISVPGGDYQQFVIPGVLAQIVVFGSVLSMCVGIAADLRNGVMDRFKSLPMTRSSVLAGRAVSEILRNVIAIAVILVLSHLLGYRFGGGPVQVLVGLGLLLLLGFALSWILAFVGLIVQSVETAQFLGMMGLFPLAFLSSAFVPAESMPGWLAVWSENQPVTVVIDAVRGLLNGDVGVDVALHPVLWCLGILAVFVPLSVSTFGRVTRS